MQGIPVRLSADFSADFADQEGMTGYIQWAKRKKAYKKEYSTSKITIQN